MIFNFNKLLNMFVRNLLNMVCCEKFLLIFKGMNFVDFDILNFLRLGSFFKVLKKILLL